MSLDIRQGDCREFCNCYVAANQRYRTWEVEPPHAMYCPCREQQAEPPKPSVRVSAK